MVYSWGKSTKKNGIDHEDKFYISKVHTMGLWWHNNIIDPIYPECCVSRENLPQENKSPSLIKLHLRLKTFFFFFFLDMFHRYPHPFYGLWLILFESDQTLCRENSPNVVSSIPMNFEPKISWSRDDAAPSTCTDVRWYD